jgi:hypothetical protein
VPNAADDDGSGGRAGPGPDAAAARGGGRGRLGLFFLGLPTCRRPTSSPSPHPDGPPSSSDLLAPPAASSPASSLSSSSSSSSLSSKSSADAALATLLLRPYRRLLFWRLRPRWSEVIHDGVDGVRKTAAGRRRPP